MKTYIQLLIIFLSISLFGQVKTINTGEKIGWMPYYETLGEFSSKNIPINDGFDSQSKIRWKSENSIYVYGSDEASFWVFDMDIDQWKCIAPETSQLNRGEKGVYSSTNNPGGRYIGAIFWTDAVGDLYLLNGDVVFNDLWKFDVSIQQWAWIGGYADDSGQTGNHGEIGVESPDFFPLHRSFATAIPDQDGYIYIYGGVGLSSHLSTDLWRYNTNNNSWTLLYENPLDSNSYENMQNIGEIGVESELNHPGYLAAYTGWFSDGHLWFFGGRYHLNYSSVVEDSYNQVWKYNLSNGLWTCMKNPNTKNAIFGVQGEADDLNTPSALKEMSNAVVIADEAYFFGGIDAGNDDPNEGLHNSLWKYNMNTNQWAWMKGNENSYNPGFYGRKGEENESNIPMSRQHSLLWTDNGSVYLFGGKQEFNKLFDIWKYNVETNNFSWVDGKSYRSSMFQNYAVHAYNLIEDEEVPSVFNFLEYTSVVWQKNKGEKLYTLHRENHGTFDDYIQLSGLWEYNVETSERYLIDRDIYDGDGHYGQLGVADEANFPPYRTEGLSLWETDDKLYLMNGHIYPDVLNDFWVFDKQTKLWTWIGGEQNQGEYYHYGEIGVPSVENYPRSRYNAATWVDEDGNLWLHGGRTKSSSDGLNDFWKYDVATGLWTLMGGNAECDSNYISEDYPSCIQKHSAWRKGNDLYFFGGYGVGYNNTSIWTGNLTDVWKYSIDENSWELVFGNRQLNNLPNFGEFQFPQITNQINTREDYVYWDDEQGNLWVYGGEGNLGDFALWKFDTTIENWVWMDGSNTATLNDYELFEYNDYNFFGPLNYSPFTYKGIGNNRYLNNDGVLWEIDINAYPNNYNKIEGTVWFDNDGNCNSDSYPISNYKFKLDQTENLYFFSDQNGQYKIFTPLLENTIIPIGLEESYFSVNPQIAQVDFETYNSSEIVNFCLSPNGQHNDLEIYIIPLQDPRPGFDIDYKIIYKNKGNTTLSGNIEFSFDDTLFEFLTSDPNVDIQNPGVLTWNYQDLHPFESREIMLSLNLSTTSVLGEELELTAVINPLEGDENEDDNTFRLTQTIIGAYDPNDKTCLEGETILEEEVGDYIHYLIRFENLGTADAINVVIKDEINTSKFDINTLIPIESSHNFYTKISDNLVEFIFEEINLPFQENLNTGYILFKIKTLESLEAGDEFNNKANIFFDYNQPIVTNNYTTLIEENLSTNEELQNSSVKIYPNPTKGLLNIVSDDAISKIEVFDMKGRLILVYNNSGIKDISSLSNGVYIFKAYTKKGMFSYKIIKQ